MKKYLFILFIFSSFIALGQSASIGLSLPEISLLDIEPDNSSIVLSLNSPTEAGDFNKIQVVNNAKWLNYSSAVTPGSSRSIFAQLGSGLVPAGTQFSVEVSSATGSGAGALGNSMGSIVLSGAPQLIIGNIGGAYTGNGTNNGHSLSYKLEVINVSQLDFNTSSTLGITYSIMDN